MADSGGHDPFHGLSTGVRLNHDDIAHPAHSLLIGIVLRGSAFAFHTSDVVSRTKRREGPQVLWERVFALSSVITPVLLGVAIGAIASGRLTSATGGFLDVFVHPWLAPFPLAVGAFALALFAFLAAVYLILETTKEELREEFRRHALAAALVVGALAFAVFVLAKTGAPEVSDGLSRSFWARLWWPRQECSRWALLCSSGDDNTGLRGSARPGR